MNIASNPKLLDLLAASYALGTLKGPARRRFEAYARQSAAVRAATLLWQERFAAMTELPAPISPSSNVWKRIEIALRDSAQPLRAGASSAQGVLEQTLNAMRQSLQRWRMAAAAGGLAGSLALVSVVWVSTQSQRQTQAQDAQIAQLQQQLLAQAALQQVQYVAVLADEQSQASVLVTFDPTKRRLVLQRVGGYQEAADKSLQLWALPPGAAPQSLGVLGQDKMVRLTAAQEQVQNVPTLAISLEPKGGVPSERGPTGPVLFKGALLKTEL
jgi:anti-sigma-K factor RskA